MKHHIRTILLFGFSLWMAACSVDPYISLSQPSSSTVPAEGGSVTISLKSNTGWTMGELPLYIKASTTSGHGNSKITFTVEKNYTHNERYADITIKTSRLEHAQSFSIRQQVYTENIPPTPPVLTFPQNHATDVHPKVTFSWEASVDLNEDEITYTLYYAQERASYTSVNCGTNTQITLPFPLGGESTYDWYVLADDGSDTAKSETHRFTTASSPYYEEEEVRVLMQNRPNNGVNLVFLCDGFVIDDLERGGECDRIVEEALNYFFDIEPYKSYQDYFNAYVVYSFSAEKGASYGTVNTLKNTSFSLTCDKESPSSTNMSCDSVKVFNYAKKAPIGPVNQTTIIVIAQEERYAGTTYMWWGGSSEWGGGKSIALLTTSQNNYPYNFKGTLQHEAGGHAFAKLADEYVNDETAKNRSRDDLVNSYTNYGIYSNVDVTSDLSLIRWKDFIGLPHYEDVGAYEGGYYFATGVWRPEPGSCMINNIAYYNAPSRAAIVRRLKTIAKETFDFEDFLANDHVTSLPAFAPDPPTKLQAYLYLAPPVLIRE